MAKQKVGNPSLDINGSRFPCVLDMSYLRRSKNFSGVMWLTDG